MKKEHALYVGTNSQQTNIQKQKHVPQNVTQNQDYKLCKIKSIKKLSKQEDVYNMEVDKHHNYSVNGGIILHNCDALRYFCKTIVKSYKI